MEDCCESVLKTNEMAALDPMDGSGTSSTKNSERTSDELLVSVKQRRKLFKNFARFVDAADEVEKKVMEKLLSVQMCTERQRDMIVGPIEKFRKELCERFEELGRDKWPRTVLRLMREQNVETVEEIRELCERGRREGKSSTSEKLKNYQNNMTVLQTENERLQERIRKCESEKLAAEKRLRKAQRAFEAEKRTAEGLKANLQHAAGEFEICRVQDEKHQIIQKRSRRASGSPTDSRRSSLRSRTREQSQGTLEEEESGDDWRRKVNGWDIQREKAVHSEKTESRRIKNAGSLSGSERSEMKGMVECMSRMMKSSALPEPRCFDGSSGDFGELKRTFLLKYGQVTSGDDELVAILEDKFLKGSAKALFKSLARRYERPIKSLFDEFEMKLRKRQGDSKAEALNEFDGLQREKSKKMWEYLTEVEKWSKLAYPEVSEETLSQMRTTKLMKAVRDDDTLHRMLIMKRLEIPLRHQYENLKDIVLQQENEKRRAYGQKKRENAVVRGKPWMDRADERRNNPHKEDRKDENVDAEKEAVGAEMVEMVDILGQKRRIVIDSGAVVSVMSTGAWERLKRKCPEWEEKVEVLAKPNFSLVDASKAKMPVREQIKVEIGIRGRKAVVVFQLVENELDIFLLGTNSFETVGVELKWKAERAVARAARKLRVPPQSCAQIAVRTEADLGDVILLESEKEWVPTSLCSKNEDGNVTILVSNWKDQPLLIKKNQVIGVGSRDWAMCKPEVAQAAINMMELGRKIPLEGARKKEAVLKILKENGEIPEGKIERIVAEFSDIFAIEDNELTQTNMTECAIELEKEEPIRQKCRPVPLALQEKVRGMLKDMEERCVIKKCRSPWASPVVLVKKKDGSIRMCVDYRKLNAVIKLNAHPLPHIESTLQALRGKKWFTTLDLMAVLNEQNQFEVMPFGLATSPAVFQATMEEVLGEWIGKSVHVYIDDILIASETENQHAEDLEKVLRRIRTCGLKLKAQKCKIAQKEVDYLGHAAASTCTANTSTPFHR
uniref:Reverse transcriptase domain-containing protein n=1 Tax=Caenorhabditis japonica TaxID=281687 RepID=A0A8R1EUJ5_CAEJA